MAEAQGARRINLSLVGVVGIVVLAVAAGVAAGAYLLPRVTEWLHGPHAKAPDRSEKQPSHELIRDTQGRPVRPPTLRLSEEAARSIGLRADHIVKAVPADKPRALPPLEGTLAYENNSLFSVRPRFAGEVAEITQVPMSPWERDFQHTLSGPPHYGKIRTTRPLGLGDRVKEGDLLAVVWSKDLGDKKAALIDALIDLHRDRKQLETFAQLYERGALPKTTYDEKDRTVKKEINQVHAAERTLRIWKLGDREIADLKREAATIANSTRDPKEEKDWARVEVRAPHGGMIVEKNTNVGDWVDPSNGSPLFRIADLRTLAVWITPPEEYLPVLENLIRKGDPESVRCKLGLYANPEGHDLEGPLLRIAPSLDPNQHTLLVMGRVANPGERLRVGQFVTATVYVRPGPGLVEIPTTALNEERGQSLVFVQPDPKKREFAVRRVGVTERFKDRVFVRSRLDPNAAVRPPPGKGLRGPWPVEPLRPGERVVAQGVPMLTAALRDLLAREATSTAEKK
jgi:cobalt-zinc-cadmium efflux system membrane fusion protein